MVRASCVSLDPHRGPCPALGPGPSPARASVMHLTLAWPMALTDPALGPGPCSVSFGPAGPVQWGHIWGIVKSVGNWLCSAEPGWIHFARHSSRLRALAPSAPAWFVILSVVAGPDHMDLTSTWGGGGPGPDNCKVGAPHKGGRGGVPDHPVRNRTNSSKNSDTLYFQARAHGFRGPCLSSQRPMADRGQMGMGPIGPDGTWAQTGSAQNCP